MNDLVLVKQREKRLDITKAEKESKKIVKELGTTEFGVPSTTMLKTQLYFEIEQLKKQGITPQMYVFYIDLDNLKMMNTFEGEELTDTYIKSLLEEYSKHITIGKNNRSDELVGIARNIHSEEEAIELQKVLSNISVGSPNRARLSGSVGYSHDFSKGLGQAILEAEERMAIDKKEKKSKDMNKAIGEENVEKHVEEIFTMMLDKLRINIEKLDEAERNLLEKNILGDKETFKKGLENPEKHHQDKYEKIVNSKSEEHVVDSIFARIEEEERKFDMQTSTQVVQPEVRQNIILAKILKENAMIGNNQEYFDKIEARKGIQKNNFLTNIILRNRQLCSVGLSNIKGLNDEKGHAICDEEIKKAVMQVQQILESNDIKIYNIIAAGISDIKFVIKKQDSEKTKTVIQQIEEVKTDLYMACDIQDLAVPLSVNKDLNKAPRNIKRATIKKDKPHEYYKMSVENASMKNNSSIQKKLNYCKIKNVGAIEKYKEKLLREFYNSNIFEMYANKEQKSKDEILKECLKRVLKTREKTEEGKQMQLPKTNREHKNEERTP